MTTEPAENEPLDEDSIPHAGEGSHSALYALLRKRLQKPGLPSPYDDTLPAPLEGLDPPKGKGKKKDS